MDLDNEMICFFRNDFEENDHMKDILCHSRDPRVSVNRRLSISLIFIFEIVFLSRIPLVSGIQTRATIRSVQWHQTEWRRAFGHTTRSADASFSDEMGSSCIHGREIVACLFRPSTASWRRQSVGDAVRRSTKPSPCARSDDSSVVHHRSYGFRTSLTDSPRTRPAQYQPEHFEPKALRGSWQHEAARRIEQTCMGQSLLEVGKASSRWQGGLGAGLVFFCPACLIAKIESYVFRVLLLHRLHVPLPSTLSSWPPPSSCSDLGFGEDTFLYFPTISDAMRLSIYS